MRNLKKFLALVLAMLMVVSASAMVSADDFTDVAADNAYAAAINDLAVKGIVRGTSDTTFTPDADVQRYQMALFMARATTGEVGVEADSTVWANGIVPFADVTEYKGAIQHAFLNGIIKGRDAANTTFDPAGNIAYVDALTMAVRALGYTDCEYPWGFYNKAVELGLTAGVAVDALYTTLDRAETAQIIYNMIYAERANSDISFATENFDLDVVRSSDLFVITATPMQSYAEGYNSKDYKEEGTYVGVQAVVNGIPEGDLIYLPVELLGIEAKDVEDYLNYAVELINYDAETGEFYDVKLGDAPAKVYSADVKFDDNSATKIVVDGTIYNIVETVSGTVLKNELVAFAGSDINTYTAKTLVVIGDTVVDQNGYAVATLKGYVGNTKYYASMTNVDIDGDGVLEIKAGTIIPEDLALKAWGYEAMGTEYIKYSTLSADEIEELGAFELQLFDDNKDGKYDRAVASTVYMTVYSTYEKDINTKTSGKEVCDRLVYTHEGVETEAANVTYSEELEVGTLFTYTYNDITNKVNVIDTFEIQTGKLNKIDTTDDNRNYKLTFGETEYTAKANYTAANLGAITMPFAAKTSTKLTLENLDAGLIFNTISDWTNFLKTNALGYEYNFYAVNGFVIFAEVITEDVVNPETKIMVLDTVADFDFGKMDLNVYADGVEQVVSLNKFNGTTLSDLPSWFYAIFLGQIQNFYRGSIYAVNNTADGINVLDIVTEENRADYGLPEKITLDNDAHGIINDDVITFDRGIVRVGADNADLAYGDRIRTTAETVFYFIDYGTGIENQNDTKISVYVGAPEDATITLDEDSYILLDKIGYKKNSKTQGSTKLIIVVNAADIDFDIEVERDAYAYFTGDVEAYVADDATDLWLEGYAEGAKFYEFTDGAFDIDTGYAMTIYSPVPNLTANKIYEVDENGVILGYEEMTTANVADYEYTLEEIANLEDDDQYELFNGADITIDFLYDEYTFDVTVKDDDPETDDNIFDYDDYEILDIRVTNVGEESIFVPRGSSSTLEYKPLSQQSAWDKVVNLFRYDVIDAGGINNDIQTTVVAVRASATKLLLYVWENPEITETPETPENPENN